MTRVKRGVTTKRKHKKVLKRAKGFTEARRKRVKAARETILKAETYALRDRRRRKRDMRRLWINQINAALTPENLSYSKFISGLKKAKIDLDRKILATLAQENPKSFKEIVTQAKAAIEKTPTKTKA